MNHRDNLATLTDRAFACLDNESTPAELGPHVTADQARILADAERQIHDVLAARSVQPARAWRTPTEVRRAVAERVGAGRDAIGRGRAPKLRRFTKD